MKIIDKQLFKFLLVGVVNTIIGAGVMFLLYNAAHCSYWFSSAMNYVVGGIVSFFLNKYFTFENKTKSFKQVLYFIITLIICYLIAYVGAKYLIYWIFQNLNDTIKDNIAMIIGMCLYTGINYFVQKLIVFKKKDEENE